MDSSAPMWTTFTGVVVRAQAANQHNFRFFFANIINGSIDDPANPAEPGRQPPIVATTQGMRREHCRAARHTVINSRLKVLKIPNWPSDKCKMHI